MILQNHILHKFPIIGILTLSFLSSNYGQTPANQPVVMGVKPEVLLKLLPKAPEQWKLLKSSASNQVSAYPALLTVATREYRWDPPPQTDPAVPQPPPKMTKLALLDTAFDPDRAFVFSGFKADPKREDGIKRSVIEGAAVTERQLTETSRKISFALDSRFLLSMTLENQNDKDRDEWIRLIGISALMSAAHNAEKLPPTPKIFLVSAVNELNPKENQSANVAYMTQEERLAAQKNLLKQPPTGNPGGPIKQPSFDVPPGR